MPPSVKRACSSGCCPSRAQEGKAAVHNVELDASQDLVPPTAMDTDGEAGQEEHLDDQSMGVAAKRSIVWPAPGEKPPDKRLRTSVDPQKLDLGWCFGCLWTQLHCCWHILGSWCLLG